jgi:hypothetical protein
MTGAGKMKVDQGEKHGNHQEGLNGDQVATENRAGMVINCRETSDGRRRRADVGVYIKALSKTEEEPTNAVSVTITGTTRAPAAIERESE